MGTDRFELLQRARLYLVCDRLDAGPRLEHLLDAALAGGVELIQLRDHEAADEELLAAAPIFRAAAERHGVPFLINDRPDLVAACGAHGVHIGQEDMPVAAARGIAGADAIVGLSTHRPDQLDAAHRASRPSRPDYLSVGPVHPTPTKPGRPAAGLDYVRYAAAHAELPWFAIGGLEPGNVTEAVAAGALRIVVVRAIRDAPDPERTARLLRTALDRGGTAGPSGTSGDSTTQGMGESRRVGSRGRA